MTTAQHVVENRELVVRFVDAVWNGEDPDALDELAAADLVVHGLGAGVDRTREEFAAFHGGLAGAVILTAGVAWRKRVVAGAPSASKSKSKSASQK